MVIDDWPDQRIGAVVALSLLSVAGGVELLLTQFAAPPRYWRSCEQSAGLHAPTLPSAEPMREPSDRVIVGNSTPESAPVPFEFGMPYRPAKLGPDASVAAPRYWTAVEPAATLPADLRGGPGFGAASRCGDRWYTRTD